MRKIIFIAFLLFGIQLQAQQDLTLFQFSGIPQTNLVNPSTMINDKFVIGMPALSSVNTVYNNRLFALDDGFLTEDGTLLIDTELLLKSMDDKNFINTQVQDQWLLVGMRLKNHYFQFAISEKFAFDLAFPKTLFDFLLKGNAHYLGERVSIEGFAINATHYREVSLGYATEISDKWKVGGHLNLLFGLANIHTASSNIGIYTDAETFDITIDGNIEVNTSGINDIQGDAIDYLSDGSNFGIGIDLGATYYPTKDWEVSMSIIDLGAITWRNDLITYTNNAESFNLTGIDIKDYINGENLDGDSIINEITDSLGNVFSLDEIEKKYTTSLTPKWYGGGKYSINDKNRVYASMTLQFFDAGVRTGFSLGYEFDLNKILGLTANYSIYNNSFTNFGLGLRVRGGPVQFYIISDSMLASFSLFSYRSIHIRFGINFLFGKLENKTAVKNNLL